jgi:tetratricopeptide (TPR) repeat protein
VRLSILVLGGVLWAGSTLAQSNPFDALRNSGDPRFYEEHKTQWLARVEARPQDVDVLEGAAGFFMVRDRAIAQELLERARAIEPENPRWPQQLAQLHELNASRGDPYEARQALAELERAHALTDPEKRISVTGLAEAALAADDIPKARDYAQRLLQQAPTSWNYGDAVHKGNLVLGRIAVREGRIVEAVAHLRASGVTPGSPVLGSFGPNMSLAKELLERGERDAVLAYFEQCRAFWKMGGPQLDAWTEDVKAGRVPRFGANLLH